MLTKRKISDSAFLVKSASTSILFGCSADIVKILQALYIKTPDAIVIPDVFFQFGTYLAALEFPFYNFVFSQHYKPGSKINIIGSSNAIKRTKAILMQTIHGPTEQEMKKWKIPQENITRYLKQASFLQQNMPKIDDALNFTILSEQPVQQGNIKIRRISANSFEAEVQNEKTVIDLNLSDFAPPFFCSPHSPLFTPIQSGLLIIGTGNGFSPYEENSSVIVYENYIPIAVDGGQWTREKLKNSGIDLSSIPIVVLTHVHDDHANILDMIITGIKPILMTSKVIYEGFVKKTSAILDIQEDTIKENINFKELIPGKTQRFYGIDFLAHETFHSIPTIGLKINDKIIIGGDGLWGNGLQKAYEKGIITRDYYESQQNIPLDKEAKIIFMDAGGKNIHPEPQELISLPEQTKKKMILNHTCINLIPPGKGLRTACTGKVFTIKKGGIKLGPEVLETIYNSPLFSIIKKHWFNVFLACGKINNINCGDSYPANNDKAILLSGFMDVLTGKRKRTLKCGDLLSDNFQEKLIARTDVQILTISHTLFNEFQEQDGWQKLFITLQEAEQLIYEIPELWRLEQKTILQLIICNGLYLKKVKTGSSFTHDEELIIVKTGAFSCSKTFISGQFILPSDSKLTCNKGGTILSINVNKLAGLVSGLYIKGLLMGKTF